MCGVMKQIARNEVHWARDGSEASQPSLAPVRTNDRSVEKGCGRSKGVASLNTRRCGIEACDCT